AIWSTPFVLASSAASTALSLTSPAIPCNSSFTSAALSLLRSFAIAVLRRLRHDGALARTRAPCFKKQPLFEICVPVLGKLLHAMAGPIDRQWPRAERFAKFGTCGRWHR